MAKMLIALAGWFIGYDGHYLFENIGEKYVEHKVPYVGLRAYPAILGSLTVPVVFLIMKESGYDLAACILAASLVLFDNAQVAESRLILLDSTLVFSVACSLYAYVRFSKHRREPFTQQWWTWLFMTGFALSCVISTKYVGLFTFFTIGAAVAVDLWDLLDIKRGLSMAEFGRHFVARAIGLIVVPFIIYLSWFYIHFMVLSKSGPGDDFMSPAFQETLSDNAMTAMAIDVNYYDKVTIMHKGTKAFLHSHVERYPLRYDDGRVSSSGQQVTAYQFNDTNNVWQILSNSGEERRDKVRNNDVVRLYHVGTQTMLLTHDVASPYYPTNQEFTTIPLEEANGERYNETLFTIEMDKNDKNDKSDIRTKSGLVKFVHVPTRVAMWTNPKPLPEWAFKQQEVNGAKNILQQQNIWFFDEITDLDPTSGRKPDPSNMKKVKKLSFFTKYIEAQRLMFHHNNMLTSSHPYSSHPISWPFLLRGVSFWTLDSERQQIYFLGNPIGWWLEIALVAVFTGVLAADQLTRRRAIYPIEEKVRNRLYNSVGFFLLAWACHYLPFYLMGRQLFLHHYLPSQLSGALLSGALFQFLLSRNSNKSRRRKQENEIMPFIVTGAIVAILAASFVYFAPITYGTTSLTVEQVLSRKWLDTWDLHHSVS